MATVGSLIINVGANIAEFTKGMGDASRGLAKFAGGLGMPLTIGAAAMGLKHLVDSSEETIARQTKLAEKLGITTERMAGLELGAKTLGIEIEGLAPSFRHLQVAVAEAGIQGGEAQKKFAKIGFDPKTLKLDDFEGNIGKIADHINTMTDPAQKVAAWMELGGRHVQTLVPLLSKGSQGMAEMEDRAKRMGVTFTGAEGAAVVAGLRAWKTAWADLGAAVDGVGNKIAIATAGTKAPTLMSKLAERFVSGVGFLTTGVDYLTSDSKNMEDWARKKITAMKQVEEQEKKQTKAQQDFLAMAAEQSAFKQTTDQLNEAIMAQRFAASGMPEKLESWRAAQRGLTEAHQAEIEALARVKRQEAEAFQIRESLLGPLDLLRKKLVDQRELVRDNKLGMDEFAQSIGKAGLGLIEMSGVANVQLPVAAAAGSREAYSIIARSQAGERDPTKLLENAIKSLTQKAEEQRKLQERMAKALEDPKFMVMTGR